MSEIILSDYPRMRYRLLLGCLNKYTHLQLDDVEIIVLVGHWTMDTLRSEHDSSRSITVDEHGQFRICGDRGVMVSDIVCFEMKVVLK